MLVSYIMYRAVSVSVWHLWASEVFKSVFDFILWVIVLCPAVMKKMFIQRDTID